MDRISLFISAVSSEFAEDPASPSADSPGNFRGYLRKKLEHPDVGAMVQEDFIDGGVLTLDRLVLYIKQCHAVIHLVGEMVGAPASRAEIESVLRLLDLDPSLPPGAATLDELERMGLSYTQWEAYIALQLRRPLLIFQKDPTAPRASRFKSDDDQRRRQAEHLARLEDAGRHVAEHFTSRESLGVEIWRNISLLLRPDQRQFIAGLEPKGDTSTPRDAVVSIRLSRPHHVSAMHRVVAITAHCLRGDISIAKVSYTLETFGSRETRVSTSDANAFMAHFENTESASGSLGIEVHFTSRGKISSEVPIKFADSSNRIECKIDWAGAIQVEQTPVAT